MMHTRFLTIVCVLLLGESAAQIKDSTAVEAAAGDQTNEIDIEYNYPINAPDERRLMGRRKKGRRKKNMKSKGMSKKKSSSHEIFAARGRASFELSNTCVTNRNCIRAATNGRNYAPNEYCEWTITNAASLHVTMFDLDLNYDFVFVGDMPGFTGTGTNVNGVAIDGLAVSKGDTIIFSSDDRTERTGFEICLV